MKGIRTLFATTLSAEIRSLRRPRTQRELSRDLLVSQASLSQYQADVRIPDESQLRILVTHWPERSGAIRLLIAYLRDVILRTAPGSVVVRPRNQASSTEADTDFCEALDRIRHHVGELKDTLTRDLIVDLASILAREDIRMEQPSLIAAEARGAYSAQDKSKKRSRRSN